MEKNNEKEFKQTRLMIVLVAIIIILVFVVGVLIGERRNNNLKPQESNKVVDKKDSTEKEEEPKKEDKKEEQSKKKIDEKAVVSEAKSLIPIEMCGHPMMPLNKKDVAVNQLDNEIKGEMIIGKYTNIDIDNPVHIKEEDIAKYFEDVSFLDYLKKDENNQYTLNPSTMTYSNGEYIIETYATGCEGAYEGDSIEYVDYTLEGNSLTLIYAYYWQTYNYEEEYTTYYKEKNGKVIYDKLTIDPNSKDYKLLYKGKEITYDQFNKYEFTFTISDNNLYFQKITYKEVK